MNTIQKKPSPKKKILVTTLALVGIIAIYLIVAWYTQKFPFSERDRTYTPGEQVVNLERTGTEKQDSKTIDQNPDKKVENNQNDTPAVPETNSTSGKQVATVLITNAGIFNDTVSASGFATNIVETTGSCEYVFTNGSAQLIKQSSVLPNASSTTCATVSFPSSELQATGAWKVVLRYSSATSEGTSPERGFQR